ncbi:MAG: hypothetical protein IJ279_07770 [Clostridia bacterium]|nr:hypothetical protein [Clostridia bacterium]
MKHTKKLLAIILAGLMVFSIFTVSASAKEMTKDEVVDFYHALLEKTAEKHEKVFITEERNYMHYADFSELTYLDRAATEKEYGFSEEVNQGDVSFADYYYGFNSDNHGEDDIQLYDYFEIDYYIENGYGLYDASYTDSKIVIDLLMYDDNDYSNRVITVYLTENKGIRKVVEKAYDEYGYESSLEGKPFAVISECVSEYIFSYNPIIPESITLSETEITLGYKDVAEIECIVNPSNATYKEICATYSYDIVTENEPVNAYEEDGRIIIEGLNEGESTVYVHALLGEVIEEIEVTVEFTFFDRIHKMFDDMIENIRMMFGLEY